MLFWQLLVLRVFYFILLLLLLLFQKQVMLVLVVAVRIKRAVAGARSARQISRPQVRNRRDHDVWAGDDAAAVDECRRSRVGSILSHRGKDQSFLAAG